MNLMLLKVKKTKRILLVWNYQQSQRSGIHKLKIPTSSGRLQSRAQLPAWQIRWYQCQHRSASLSANWHISLRVCYWIFCNLPTVSVTTASRSATHLTSCRLCCHWCQLCWIILLPCHEIQITPDGKKHFLWTSVDHTKFFSMLHLPKTFSFYGKILHCKLTTFSA